MPSIFIRTEDTPVYIHGCVSRWDRSPIPRLSNILLCILVATSFISQCCYAAPLRLSINVNIEGRRFLISSQQKIIVTIENPASEDDTTTVAAIAFQPISDSTQLLFEPDAFLYMDYWPAVAFGRLSVTLQQSVTYGMAYSFNGVQINGDSNRLDEFISIYYDAPLNSQPVIAGMAWYIYDASIGRPSAPSPINYYTLNRFEARIIRRPLSVARIFIASGISTGTIIPLSIMKPISEALTNTRNVETLSNDYFSTPQIGRYLSVNVDSSNQTVIHFDTAINAFVEGPNPTEN